MGSFVEELWGSVFTPGPTPTLLVATNVTFAALQVVLFMLLLATYSIHFLILSVLSGSLWYSINWFARELQVVQAQEAEKKEAEVPTEEKAKSDSFRKTPGALDSTESDTETESLMERKVSAASGPTPQPTPAAAATLQPPDQQGEVRKRLSVSGESSGYQSTDSEWEKVDDNAAA
ncbi:Pkr1-domain-containing protein [Aspergillus avenaceus]|uniref:Pkr1-domain-containing protein n=1 Tax=Aspergillus avenaceus TaxID=36643 RepID=A0A5N6U468_ASPAV|nr:Pkr1-domain-containing protein [Aspergillus avenaceus]